MDSIGFMNNDLTTDNNLTRCHRYQSIASLLNKSMLEINVSNINVLYSTDNQYSVLHSSNFIILIDNDKNEIRSKHYVSEKSHSIVKVRLTPFNITFLVRCGDYQYIGILSFHNLGEFFTYKTTENVIDFFYIDQDPKYKNHDKLLIINSQFDVSLMVDLKPMNKFNMLLKSGFSIDQNFKIIHIDYDEKFNSFFLFLESGTIIPLRVILVNLDEGRWEITYLDQSLLHFSHKGSSNLNNDSHENRIQEKQSVSSIFSKVSVKKEDKIILKHVKLSPVEIILPNYQNSMEVETLTFEQEVFRVIVIIFELKGNSYLRLIKVNSKTYDLILINTFELNKTKVHDIYLSNCFNCTESDRKILKEEDFYYLFVLAQHSDSQQLHIVKLSMLDCMLEKSIDTNDRVVINSIKYDVNSFANILNVLPLNILPKNDCGDRIQFNVFVRTIQIGDKNTRTNSESFIRDFMYSEESKTQIDLVLNQNNVYDYFFLVLSKQKDNKELYESRLKELKQKVEEYLASIYENIDTLKKTNCSIDYYLLYLIQTSSNFTSINIEEYLTLHEKNSLNHKIGIDTVVQTVEIYYQILISNIFQSEVDVLSSLSKLNTLNLVLSIINDRSNLNMKRTSQERLADDVKESVLTKHRFKIQNLYLYLVMSLYTSLNVEISKFEYTTSNVIKMLSLVNDNQMPDLSAKRIEDEQFNSTDYYSPFLLFSTLYYCIADSVHKKLEQKVPKGYCLMNFGKISKSSFQFLEEFYDKYSEISHIIFNLDKFDFDEAQKFGNTNSKLLFQKGLVQLVGFVGGKHKEVSSKPDFLRNFETNLLTVLDSSNLNFELNIAYSEFSRFRSKHNKDEVLSLLKTQIKCLIASHSIVPAVGLIRGQNKMIGFDDIISLYFYVFDEAIKNSQFKSLYLILDSYEEDYLIRYLTESKNISERHELLRVIEANDSKLRKLEFKPYKKQELELKKNYSVWNSDNCSTSHHESKSSNGYLNMSIIPNPADFVKNCFINKK